MPTGSLEQKLTQAGSLVDMLRSNPKSEFPFPIPPEYTNWRDEQEAWGTTAVLFDQSHHMTDIYFKGPDLHRLLSDFGVNNFTTFGKNKAKQLVAVNAEGAFIGDGILFGLKDDEYSLVGTPVLPNWIAYNAQAGSYDVEVRRDERSTKVLQPGRLTFRYQLQGPRALEIAAKAANGTLPRIKFFNIGDFTIAGTPVRALNHTMTGIPGLESTGLEMTGPAENGPRVLDALLAAGEEFGLRQGGARSYGTSGLESGWIALPVPALYTSPSLRPYREHLPADGFLAAATLGGSFYSADIEDYYLTPWDLGYGRLIHWDHDFLGRDALRRRADEPHRAKVILNWNADDAGRALLDSLFADDEQRARYFELPSSTYTTFQYDAVHVSDEPAGISTRSGYLAGRRGFVSLAMLDQQHAREGAEVVITWGEATPEAKPYLERHAPRPIRATVGRVC